MVRKKRTLRYKFIIGFVIVTVPLILFLFYNNYYAMNVVREQVSQSNNNLISTQAAKKDIALGQTVNYLLRQVSTNPSYPNLLTLSSYPEESGDYFFAKQALLTSFDKDQAVYKEVDTFFVYLDVPGRLLTSQRTYWETERYHLVLDRYLADKKRRVIHDWDIIQADNAYYLVRLEQVADAAATVYVGVLIKAEQMIDELNVASSNSGLEELLVSNDGRPLTATSLTAGDVEKIENSLKKPDNEAYSKFNRSNGLGYLAVNAAFSQAPIHMIAIVPENNLLKQLFYFQWAIYLIPVIGLVVILFYSFFLKRTLLQPMQALMSGMRRIMHGDLSVRLKEGSSFEFAFLIDTFNGMAGQISKLKIDVYEGLLKKQEAEFKHLQAQINPHFYLNSLNIIYSLSSLRKNELVEQMTEHLADYFRFITRAHREFITLSEEIDHISNYLEIQKLRFPDKLAFEVDLPERFAGCPLPPLTIQPFIENAVIHGMPEGERPYVISITVQELHEDSGSCEIIIADNGCGLTADKLQQLQRGNESEGAGQGAGGLGIWNVRRRLGMIYGNRAEIRFSGREPDGTIVSIRLPVERDNEGGDSDV
ncbi:sensor histidine kinase [Paenibacillus sacheonensis]|uniref:HAMP domain-containing protein n=1 Tax=Paenibacillus sacheonensis TaxID=742054 RepID=A0A7X4YPJ6_9BACL|nr:sensor histidine kinase [Paenibacillus sacheonensis]MBM7565025.1 two-component system sensor histidine kinase YesM [Paenibacillus sacheonensis]NBC70190.1 HAMP domain-containing protein [Paenibacillus sacheonensis]